MSGARRGAPDDPTATPATPGWRRQAWRLYERLPRAADLPLRIATRALLPIANRHVPLTRLEGPVAAGRRAALLFAGAPSAAAWIAQRFFATPPAATPLGVVAIRRLGAALAARRAEADLVVARLDRLSAMAALDRSYVAVPEWIGAVAPVPADVWRFCHARKSLRHNVNRLQRAGIAAEVSHAPRDFDEFYERLYLPFTRRRHGAASVVSHPSRLRRCFRQGGVMWIRHGDARVAGLLFRSRGRTLDLVVVGMVDGPFDPLREGAAFALDVYLFEHARRLGCTAVDFGGSRPSLRDGLLLYKTRWDARLVQGRTSFYDLRLAWDRLSPALLEFLARTPLVVRQADGFAALAGPGATPALREARLALRSLRRVYLLDGDARAGGGEAAAHGGTATPVVRIDPMRAPCWRPPRGWRRGAVMPPAP